MHLLSEIDYDAAGNVVKTKTYNNKIANSSGDYATAAAGVLSGNQEQLPFMMILIVLR